MGGIFKGKINRNLIEKREAKHGGSNPDSYRFKLLSILKEKSQIISRKIAKKNTKHT